MTHASLFSGIGGFDLAAEWMEWNNIFHCEWNPFGQRVLAHHFPNSKSYNDITKTDFSIHRGEIDILTGGFPCQPYSSAGKRLGKADERHLFPHMLRCIKEVKPRWVVGENVRGLVNWNEGMVFNEVYDDLEREGYEVQSFLIPAAGVNAPHQRYRIWFVAYSNDNGGSSRFKQVSKENGKVSEWNKNAESGNANSFITSNTNNEKRFWESNNNREWENKEQKSYNGDQLRDNIGSISKSQDVTNSEQFRLEYRDETRNIRSKKTKTQIEGCIIANEFKANGYDKWKNFPTQSPICGGDDGLPRELDNITFPKWRKESIKAYGNAIVPQVAFEIFKAIQSFEDMVNV
jgi:DNA (cytosine-5)-methyltransferase 1